MAAEITPEVTKTARLWTRHLSLFTSRFDSLRIYLNYYLEALTFAMRTYGTFIIAVGLKGYLPFLFN